MPQPSQEKNSLNKYGAQPIGWIGVPGNESKKAPFRVSAERRLHYSWMMVYLSRTGKHRPELTPLRAHWRVYPYIRLGPRWNLFC